MSRTEEVPITCTTCGKIFRGTRMIISIGGEEKVSTFGKLCPHCSAGNADKFRTAKQQAFNASRERDWYRHCPENYRSEWIMERIAKPETNPPREVGQHHEKVRRIREAVNAGRGFYAWGPTGAFKTTATYHGAVKKLVWAGLPFKFVNMFRWRGEMTAESRRHGWDMTAALRPYIATPVLILDDLGNMAGTESGDEALHILTEGRMQRNLPLIVNTQYDQDQLIAKFKKPEQGEAVMRRIVLLAGHPQKFAK